MDTHRKAHQVLVAAAVTLVALLATWDASAGDLVTVDANGAVIIQEQEGVPVLLLGGPKMMVNAGIPIGTPLRIYHNPFPMDSLPGWLQRMMGPLYHTFAVYEENGEWKYIVEKTANGRPYDSGWFIRYPGDLDAMGNDRFAMQREAFEAGQLVPGGTGCVGVRQVPADYTLFQNNCTNTVGQLIGKAPRGLRGPNAVVYRFNQMGGPQAVSDLLQGMRIARNGGRAALSTARGVGARVGPILGNADQIGGGVTVVGFAAGGLQEGAQDLVGGDPKAVVVLPTATLAGFTGTSTALFGIGADGAAVAVGSAALPATAVVLTGTGAYFGTRAADNALGGRLSGGTAKALSFVYDTGANALARWWWPGQQCNYDLTRNTSFSDH